MTQVSGTGGLALEWLEQAGRAAQVVAFMALGPWQVLPLVAFVPHL